MSVQIEIKGETMIAKLIGELDHHSAAGIREEIDNSAELNMPSMLILDFEKISFMDSSGIGLVLGRYRNLSKRGAEVKVIGVSPQIYKVMKLSGIERLMQLEQLNQEEE
jgi:stage II sporulation protein AA (anti-sigma F factor antagonist)